MSSHTNRGAAVRRKVGASCRIALLILLILLILSCITLILQSVLPGDSMPGILRPSAENRDTMFPTVTRGDFLLLRSPAGGVAVNDVVSYRVDGGFVLGRVTAADDATVTVKGDAETAAFAVTIEKSAIRGVFSGFRIPLLGYPILWMQTVPGCLLFLFVFLLLDLLAAVLLQKKNGENGADDFAGFAMGGVLLLRGYRAARRRMQKKKDRGGGAQS